MSKVFVIDPAKCTGCYNCQIACKDEHVGNDWSPIAKPQPDTGHFWMNLTQKDRGTVPKVRVSYVPVLCEHCEEPACMEVAGDAAYKRDDGLVIIDPEKAKGRKDIVDACPAGNIYWNDELEIPQKCTGCAHLLDDGWEVPRCVDVCHSDALQFGDEEDFDLTGAEKRTEELGATSVYYFNLPKRFVAGEVADLAKQEVIIGAELTLTDKESGETYTATTNPLGDFWFEQVPASTYTLTLTAEGYEPIEKECSAVDADVNVGLLEVTAQ